MVMAGADAGLEKEGAVPEDCLGCGASDAHHCGPVFECTWDVKSFLPSPDTPTLGQSSKASCHEPDGIRTVDCWYPGVSHHLFT